MPRSRFDSHCFWASELAYEEGFAAVPACRLANEYHIASGFDLIFFMGVSCPTCIPAQTAMKMVDIDPDPVALRKIFNMTGIRIVLDAVTVNIHMEWYKAAEHQSTAVTICQGEPADLFLAAPLYWNNIRARSL